MEKCKIMQINSFKKKFGLIIVISIIIFLVIFVIYPLIIVCTVRCSGKKFAKVMNSHDLSIYDKYFVPDTRFIFSGKSIKYSDIRDKIVDKEFYIKEGSFYAPTDVPFDTEYMAYFKETEFTVGLHGGMVVKYSDNDIEISLDGILVLRKDSLGLHIKEVHLSDTMDESLEQHKAYEYMFMD